MNQQHHLTPRAAEIWPPLLRQLAGGGCALLIASHDEEFVRGCAHRVLTMAEGRITQSSGELRRRGTVADGRGRGRRAVSLV